MPAELQVLLALNV